jgi:hypothetical protein
MDIKHEHMKWYIDNAFHLVGGFCKNYVAKALDLIEQSPYNKKGLGVAEIGVHAGRLYILLNRTVRDKTHKSYAIDLFESGQSRNSDNSGDGKKFVFISNLLKYDIFLGENTVIIEGDSTDSALELESKIAPGSLKYVSVDGGHLPENVVNDLKLAEKWIDSEGIVILDDIMHEGWIGVIQGALKYLENSPTLQPFAIGYNKLWLTKSSMRKTYYDLFLDSSIARTGAAGAYQVQYLAGTPIVTLEDSGAPENGAYYNVTCSSRCSKACSNQ